MKPFLTGRPTATTPPLQPASGSKLYDTARVVGHKHKDGTAAPHGPGPTVEAIKQGDKVARLIVTCSCGERIEIECLYPAGG